MFFHSKAFRETGIRKQEREEVGYSTTKKDAPREPIGCEGRKNVCEYNSANCCKIYQHLGFLQLLCNGKIHPMGIQLKFVTVLQLSVGEVQKFLYL